MDNHELERKRRSIAMLSPGQQVGPLSREEALALCAEVQEGRQDVRRYREAVAELRRVIDGLEPG